MQSSQKKQGRFGRLVLPVVLCFAVGLGAAFGLLSSGQFRGAVFPAKAEGVIPDVEHLSLRRALLDRRDMYADRGELVEAAAIHAELAREAVLRARGVYDAWMPLRDPGTLLFPESVTKDQWNYRNVGADFFCFQMHTGIYTGADDLGLLYETLEAEAAYGGPDELPLPRWVGSGRVILRSTEHPRFGKRGPVFGASEYVKDGLLSLYEATGDVKVYERMREVTDAILAQSTHMSAFGAVPSTSSEVNGEMLQTLARMARLNADAGHIEMLGRLADAVVENMLAANHGLPSHRFDFERNEAPNTVVSLRDHGNEVIPGLAEAFAYAVDHRDEAEWGERAERWAEPLAEMYEKILENGRLPEGILANSFDAETGELRDGGPNDNWGYVSVGVQLFADRAVHAGLIDNDRAGALLAGVRGLALAVAKTDRLAWEDASHDGYADTIESAMLVSSHDVSLREELKPWIDDQIGVMFAMQRPGGFVLSNYLDGNFMRTALMYADMRSGGWTLEPWDDRATVGVAVDGRAGSMVILGVPGEKYTLRHRAMLHGFREVHRRASPRLNAWPEWLAPELIRGVRLVEEEGGGGRGGRGGLVVPADAGGLHGWEVTMPESGVVRLELVVVEGAS